MKSGRIDYIAQLAAVQVEMAKIVETGSGKMAGFKADLDVYLAYLEEAGKKWKVARVYHGGFRGVGERLGWEG